MCIIIAKPREAKIPMDHLVESWICNSHGGGFAYAVQGHLFMEKYLTRDLFLGAIEDALITYPHAPFLVHMRIATHGPKNLRNTHPFYVNDSLVFAHNGIIPIDSPREAGFSDTVLFNESYLKHLKPDFLKDEGTMKEIEDIIGIGSKLAFLAADGIIRIVNSKLGEWCNGTWYSNSGYKKYNGWTRADGWHDTDFTSVKPSSLVITQDSKDDTRNDPDALLDGEKWSKYCAALNDSISTIEYFDAYVETYATVAEIMICRDMTPEAYIDFIDMLVQRENESLDEMMQGCGTVPNNALETLGATINAE
jgi:hypothetical protein